MAAAVVCRYCGRDVVPLTASRIVSASIPAVQHSPAKPPLDQVTSTLAEEVARAAKISVLNERTKTLPTPHVRPSGWSVIRNMPSRSVLLRVVAIMAVLTLAFAVMVDALRPNVEVAATRSAAESTEPRAPLPPAPPLPITPSTRAAPSRPAMTREVERSRRDEPIETDPTEQVDNHLDPREAAEIGQVAADLAAIHDETLKTAIRLEALFAQARVCNLRSDRVTKAAKANAALLSSLSKGQPKAVALARRLARFGGDAQRAGRGAPCEEVQQNVLSFEGLYRRHGLLG